MALEGCNDARHVTGRRRNSQLGNVDQGRSFTASWPPTVQHGVRLPRPGRGSSLAVVLRPTPVVLVGNGAPSPVGHRCRRYDAQHVRWVDVAGVDGAAVGPAVTEGED